MPESNFIDYVKILCRSGKGGAGSRHYHRAKYVPKGGPDGGDGGRGGHILLRGNSHMWTLLPLRYRRHIFAGNGQSGSEGRSSGKDGEDITIDVPCGTVVFDAETGQYLCEVTHDQQIVPLLKGGRGGLGNWHFKSPTNRTPRYAQPGEPATERTVILELKLLADVGLVGFPNAGKSTLLSAISAARPKIADYPFTTMEPQLGIVSYRDNRSFVMADIPGIIEGASQGKGLGLRFLRHIERNAVLLFMVPADADDITAQYNILLEELRRFNPQLIDKQRILAISKSDMLDDELRQAIQTTLPDDLPHVFISAVTGQGIDTLKDLLWASITDERNQIATPAITHRPLDAHHRVTDEDQFIIQPDPQATDTDDDTEEYIDEDYGDQGQWDTHWDYDDAASRLDDDGYPTTPQQ
ncbi:GTPase ObgE [Paramuribaculum intestinale]|uniref:GTPase Obg n=1 Tax=Paramuribaculum intestinale TaxID=2094151 RepID=A0A2V1ISJ1_9BACT|nr:GTPase ObgE [Paramuribaculum intestinale]PWB05979.1 GTPase ObgE [Paramuribaculum intestinale]PWB11049.1 GTPase ObgE [Paramuribaculum intestinale]ROS89618.1 GTPase ObgE [Muribaculaceae bacterium Isolate-043 (Harlan)]WLT40854.1 GTPase ObgE [Paramuribaculum intestinale]